MSSFFPELNPITYFKTNYEITGQKLENREFLAKAKSTSETPNEKLKKLFPTITTINSNSSGGLFFVSIKNLTTDAEIFKKEYANLTEFEKESQNYISRSPNNSVDTQLFVDRLDSIQHFALDFFFPLAQKKIAAKANILTIIGALFIDVLTILVRLISLPYRAYTYQSIQKHPLFDDLKDHLHSPLAVFIQTVRETEDPLKQSAKLAYPLFLSDHFVENENFSHYGSKCEESPDFSKWSDEKFYERFHTNRQQNNTHNDLTQAAYNYFGMNADTPWSEILKEYRKRALKTHPDQNRENLNATKEFQELSNHMEALRKARDK